MYTNDIKWLTDRLRLKIPWKSKFTDPVVAEVEGLYLIAAPLSGKYEILLFENPLGQLDIIISATPYNAEKETKEAREKKQGQLKKIEEAKKREKGV